MLVVEQLSFFSSCLGAKSCVAPRGYVSLVTEVIRLVLRNELDLQVADEMPARKDGIASRRMIDADMVAAVEESHEVLPCHNAEAGTSVQYRRGFGIDLFVNGQDGNSGIVNVVFGTLRAARLHVVRIMGSFSDKEQAVNLIAELTGNGEKGRWGL